MEKWMCLGSIGVAALILLLSLLDLFAGYPFGRGKSGFSSPFMLVDICCALGSAILLYLGWNAYRDVK